MAAPHKQLKLLLITTFAIFLAEGLIMLLLHLAAPWVRQIPVWAEGVLDAAALSLLVSPFLYAWTYRPLIAEATKRQAAENALAASNIKLESLVHERTEDLRIEEEHRAALNKLLLIASASLPLFALLDQLLAELLNVPWLGFMAKGGVFLKKENSDSLILTVHRNLAKPLLTICAEVPFGRCLCGRAASTSEIQSASEVDIHHENRFEGMPGHGHYNVPIVSQGAVLGVIVLYLPEGHRGTENEVRFLKASAEVFALVIRRKKLEGDVGVFRQGLEQSANLVILTDSEGRIEYVNPKFTEVMGYTLEEIVGQTPRVLKSGQAPPEIYRTFWRDIKSGKAWRGTFSNKKKDGKLCWVHTHVSCVKDESGRTQHFLCIQEDVTDRVQLKALVETQREHFNVVANSSTEAIVAADARGHITAWNKGAERIFGYSVEEVLGQPITLIIPERLRESHQKGFARFNETGISKLAEDGTALELWGLRKDGTEIPIELSLCTWKEGDRLNVAGIIRDITERKQAESELHVAQNQLMQAEKLAALGRVAAGVAHEVKNPLGIILQGTHFLRTNQGVSDGERNEALSLIEGAVVRADRIIRGMLALSRPVTLRPEPSDLHRVINSSIALLTKQIETKSIVLQRKFTSEPVVVLIDPDQVEQVIINLISNAIQAMSSGGQLIVRTAIEEMKGFEKGVGRRAQDLFKVGERAAICEIQDTGAGVPKEYLDKVFDPFFTTKPTGEGTGLGLSIVRAIVEAHRGMIALESQEGKGTTVRMVLPLSCASL